MQWPNQCDFLTAVKLSVKIAAQPGALVNSVHHSTGWLIPVRGPTFPLVQRGLLAPLHFFCCSNYYETGFKLAKTWKLAFVGSIVTRCQSGWCGLWCYRHNQGVGPVLGHFSHCYGWRFHMLNFCCIFILQTIGCQEESAARLTSLVSVKTATFLIKTSWNSLWLSPYRLNEDLTFSFGMRPFTQCCTGSR